MSHQYVLALDQGTTSSRAALVDDNGRLLCLEHREFNQIYPRPGWVEHDPEEIWSTQLAAARAVIERSGVSVREIAALALTNQRETAVVWERRSGKPLCNAIVWQCRRTASRCDDLRNRGLADAVRERTGLVIDSYFTATKIGWILDHVPGARRSAEEGALAAGTVDTWLMWKLTGGRVHATDYTNASRTMLFNIHTLGWDERLLELLDIPRALLPEAKASSGLFGVTDPNLFGAEIPILGVAGDQQAALFGQACLSPGMAKATYGTGAFLLMNTGAQAIESDHGLLTTIGWGVDGVVEYALEGSVFIAGAAVQWLRDELGLLDHAAQSERIAESIEDTEGVYVVPAFVGLGAPYWDEGARGAIVGLTRGAGRAHIVRATLESIAYQVHDVLEAMEKDSGKALRELRVDGGASANRFLMQFQADVLGVEVSRPEERETTVMGAAFLAALGAGVWQEREEVARRWSEEARFRPTIGQPERDRKLQGWRAAVARTR